MSPPITNPPAANSSDRSWRITETVIAILSVAVIGSVTYVAAHLGAKSGIEASTISSGAVDRQTESQICLDLRKTRVEAYTALSLTTSDTIRELVIVRLHLVQGRPLKSTLSDIVSQANKREHAASLAVQMVGTRLKPEGRPSPRTGPNKIGSAIIASQTEAAVADMGAKLKILKRSIVGAGANASDDRPDVAAAKGDFLAARESADAWNQLLVSRAAAESPTQKTLDSCPT